MTEKSVQDLFPIVDGIISTQKGMAETIADQRCHIISLQFAVIAIAEQLAAIGNLDAQLAAGRLLQMGKTIEPERLRDMAQPRIAETAKRILDLGAPLAPRPPRGSKPRIVK